MDFFDWIAGLEFSEAGEFLVSSKAASEIFLKWVAARAEKFEFLGSFGLRHDDERGVNREFSDVSDEVERKAAAPDESPFIVVSAGQGAAAK